MFHLIWNIMSGKKVGKMVRIKYIVNLTEEEREKLEKIISKGMSSARTITRAQILLRADENQTVEQIARELRIGTATVERIRKRFVQGNLERALSEDPRPGVPAKLD